MDGAPVGMVMFLLSIAAQAGLRRSCLTSLLRPNVPSAATSGSNLTSYLSTSAAAATSAEAGGSSGGCEGCSLAEENMKSNGMIGSVKQHDRQVLLCGPASEWPKKIESIEAFPMSMIAQIEVAAKATATNIKITACHHTSIKTNSRSSDCSGEQVVEVIVYPDNLLFNVAESQSESFAQLLSERRPLYRLPADRLEAFCAQSAPFKQLVLVCTHGNRDKRCGRAGPQVMAELQQELSARGISDSNVAVRATSHIGGHKFAGTLIVYPEGQWYGRISKSNSKELLQHVLDKRVMHACSRGMNISSITDW